jgi:hypothetical protein
MKNWEALRALTEGKAIRQVAWLNKDHHWRSGRGLSGAEFSDLALFTDGWEIYDPSHDYAWACAELVAGRRVKRKVWNADQILARDPSSPGNPVVWANTGSLWAVNANQILATDYVSAEVRNGKV